MSHLHRFVVLLLLAGLSSPLAFGRPGRLPGTLTFSVAGSNPPAANIGRSQTDVPMIGFTASADFNEDIQIVNVTLQAGGSGNDATAIAAVKLWWDKDTNGQVTPGDQFLGQSGAPPDNGSVIVPAGSINIQLGTAKTFLLTYDMAGAAALNDTFAGQIVAASLTSASTPTAAGLPLPPANTMTVRGSLTVLPGSVGVPVQGALPGTVDVVVGSWRIATDGLEGVNLNSMQWNYNPGNWNGNVSAARIHIDADNDSLFDVGETQFGGTATVFTTPPMLFSGTASIPPASTVNLILVADISGAANPGNELWCNMMSSNVSGTGQTSGATVHVGGISGVGRPLIVPDPNMFGTPLLKMQYSVGDDLRAPNGMYTSYEWDFDNDATFDYTSATTGITANTFATPGVKTSVFKIVPTTGPPVTRTLNANLTRLERQVTAVDTDSAVNPKTCYVSGLIARPSTKRIYTTSFFPGAITTIDGDSGSGTFEQVLTQTAAPGGALLKFPFLSEATGRLYAFDEGAGFGAPARILSYNLATSTFDAAVNLPPDSEVQHYAINAATNRLYAVNWMYGRVEVIDIDPVSGTFNTVVGAIQVPGEPMRVAVKPAGNKIYVCNTQGGVWWVDGTTLQLKKQVRPSQGGGLKFFVYNPGNDRLYASQGDGGTDVFIIDATRDYVEAELTGLPGTTKNLVVQTAAPFKCYLFRGNSNVAQIKVIGGDPGSPSTLNTVLTTLTPAQMTNLQDDSAALDQAANKLYVVATDDAGYSATLTINTSSDTILTEQIRPAVVTGQDEITDALGLIASSNRFFVLYENGAVASYDTATGNLATVISSMGHPGLGLLRPSDGQLIIQHTGSNGIRRHDPVTGVQNLSAATGAGHDYRMVLHPAGSHAFFIDALSPDKLRKVDLSSGAMTTITLPAGAATGPLAINPNTNHLWVSRRNGTQGEVTVVDINSNAIVTTIVLGNPYHPGGIGVDTSNDRVIVTDVHRTLFCVRIQDVAGTPSATANITLDVSGFGDGMIVVNPGTQRAYVSWNSGVKVINTTSDTVVTTVAVSFPITLALNETLNEIYTIEEDGSTFHVISGASNTITASIPFATYGFGGGEIHVSETLGRAYIAGTDGGDVGGYEVIDLSLQQFVGQIGPVEPASGFFLPSAARQSGWGTQAYVKLPPGAKLIPVFSSFNSTVAMFGAGEITVSAGPMNPPAQTPANNATGVPVQQVQLVASALEGMNVKDVIFTANGTMNDQTAIAAVKLYEDADNTGTVTGPDTLLGTSSFSADNGTVTFTGAPLFTMTAGSTKRLLVVYDLNGSASSGQDFTLKVDDGMKVVADGSTTDFPARITGTFPVTSNLHVINSPPLVPSAANQYRLDGLTVIPLAGWTNETGVIFQATVTDDGNVALEVELKPNGTAFDGLGVFTSSFVTSGSVASVTVGGLADGSTHHWRYRAKDLTGATSAWVDFDAPAPPDFQVDLGPPSLPVLLAPANGAVVTLSVQNLDWSDSTDPGSGIQNYDVQVATDAGFTAIVDSFNPAGSLYMTTPLGDGQKFWRVRARDAAGNVSVFTAAFSYTIDTVPPSVPTLLTPTVCTNSATPLFDWTDSTDATSGVLNYDIDIATDGSFTVIVQFSSPGVSQFTPTPLATNTYFWRVRARDNAGNVSGYAMASFDTDTTAPSVPVPTGPVGGVSKNSGSSSVPTMVLDSSNNPVIAWIDDTSGNGEIYVARWNGTAWVGYGGSNAGGGVSNTAGFSNSPSLRLESGTNNPVVAWSEFNVNDEIWVRRWNGTAWVGIGGSDAGGGVSNNAGSSRNPSLALDASNNPTVAWDDTTSSSPEIYYRQWNGSTWAELAGSATGPGLSNLVGSVFPSQQMTVGGLVYIAWRQGTEIYMRFWNGGSWAELAGSGSGGGVSSNVGISDRPKLALDGSGNPTIAWHDDTPGNDEIYLKQWNGSAWIELAGSATGGGISGNIQGSSTVSLAMSPTFQPVVAWQQQVSTAYHIHLRAWNGSVWIEVGGSATGTGLSGVPGPSQQPSLSIDSSGNPRVAWTDYSFTSVEVSYKSYNGSAWIELDYSASATGTCNSGGIVSLDWSAATDIGCGMQDYDVQVDDDPAFGSPNFTQTVAALFTNTTPLGDGTWYFRVRSRDLAGNVSAFSSPGSFGIDTTGPTTPTLLLPANGACVTTPSVALDWSDATDAGCAGLLDYHVEVATDAGFTILVVNLFPTLSDLVTSPLSDGGYFWRVTARDGFGNVSVIAGPFTLSVDSAPPSVPTLLTPADLACATATPTLTWAASTDAGCGVLNYDFEVASDPSFLTIVQSGTQVGTSTALSPLGTGTFYWRVAARDVPGQLSAPSASFSFTVDGTAPSVPTLSFPANGGAFGAGDVPLAWNAAADVGCGIMDYDVEVDDNAAFSSLSFSATTSFTSQTTSSLPDGTYFWRVRSRDLAGNVSAFSSVFTFIVDTMAPVPGFVNDGAGPDSDAQVSTSTISANWGGFTDSSPITQYEWAIGTTPGATDVQGYLAIGLSTSATNGALSLTVGQTYYVTVRAMDSVGLQSTQTSDGITIVPNNPPNSPTGLLQKRLDGVTIIPIGGTTTETAFIVEATATDVEADQIRLEVEVVPFGSPFTGVPTDVGLFGLSGATMSVTITVPTGQFNWQVRSEDVPGGVSAWVTQGGLPDIVVSPPPPSGAPTAVSPSGLSPAITPTLVWTSLGGGVTYDVDVASDAGFTTILFSATGVADTQVLCTTALLEGGYFWRVRGFSGVAGPYSSAASFTVDLTPTASPPSGDASLAVNFTATFPGAILYEWDYEFVSAFSGDYASASSGDSLAIYAVPGSYTAKLRIHYPGGSPVIEKNLVITVTPPPVAPALAITAPVLTGLAPLTVNFTATITTFDGTVSAFLWDFESDGTIDFSSGISNLATHTFTAVGTYTVRSIVVDALGNAGAGTVTVTVTGLAAGDAPAITTFTSSTPAAIVGQVVSFSATADPGASGSILAFLWDFDGDGAPERIEANALPGVVTSNVTAQYESPGAFLARVTVLDSDVLTSQATTPETISVAPTVFRCWIDQPRLGNRVWGDYVSVQALTTPAAETASVEFKYRPAGAGGFSFPPANDASWIAIGTVTPPPTSSFGVHWDVTGLVDGASYEVIAFATSTTNPVQYATSSDIEGTIVIVDSVNPDEVEFHGSPFTKVRVRGVDPNRTVRSEVARDTVMEVAAGSTSSYDRLRMERRSENPHPIEGTLQGLKFVPGKFRKIGFDAGSTLSKPAKLAVYFRDADGDGLVDGTSLEKATLKIVRWEDTRGRWEPMVEQVVNLDEALVKAEMVATGDIGVIAEIVRETSSKKKCGLLGMEAALLALIVVRWWRRRNN